LIIRDFREKDFDGIVELAKKSFVEEFEIGGFDPDVWRHAVHRRFSISGRLFFGFLGLFNREPLRFFVAEVDGKIVGTTMVTVQRRVGYISTVMVHPDFRRKGIATALMKTAINNVQKRKSAKTVLHVVSTNDSAKDLYLKLGLKKFDDTFYLTADVDSLPNLDKAEAIQVRAFQKSDLDTVYTLIKSSRDPNWLKVYDFKKGDLKNSFWNRLFRMSTMKRIVAVKEGEIVGYASASYTTAKETARIANIDVFPEMTSNGIEEELIRASVDFIKPSGAKKVLAIVPLTKGNLIKKLETLGFKKWIALEGMVLE
jgi:ribosomal protein S18 acetylase RimI-like enzyme